MDVSEGIWTYPRGKMDVQGIFKGGHFVRDAEVAGSNPVAPIFRIHGLSGKPMYFYAHGYLKEDKIMIIRGMGGS